MDSEPMVSAEVEFAVAGETARAKLTVSAGYVAISDILPACRSISEVIVNRAVERVEKAGNTISCKAGCGACCRQIVPISEPEARVLARVVHAMEEPRRSTVLGRFADARQRIEAAGLAEKVWNSGEIDDPEPATLATDYFRLGIPCPFLENESCSIYDERPLICREYLVTNDPRFCADPSPDTIDMVPMPAMVSSAIIQVGLKREAKRVRWVPLPMALDWVAEHPVEEHELRGPALIEEFFARLASTGPRRMGDEPPVEPLDAE